MEEICERENLRAALQQMDGMTFDELPAYLMQHWPANREQLLSGTYKPRPVFAGMTVEPPQTGDPSLSRS